MTAIHHTIIKAITKTGASINEFNGEFVLTNDDMGLRATSNDARELRALAQRWADGEDTEDYVIEDEVSEDDEQELAGSVVKAKYKEIYKQRGSIDHCGDWLSYAIREWTRNANDEFVLSSFINVAERNGITDWAKYNRGDAGSNGRMVMNVSNRLRSIVRKAGVLHINEYTTLEAPESFMKKA